MLDECAHIFDGCLAVTVREGVKERGCKFQYGTENRAKWRCYPPFDVTGEDDDCENVKEKTLRWTHVVCAEINANVGKVYCPAVWYTFKNVLFLFQAYRC